MTFGDDSERILDAIPVNVLASEQRQECIAVTNTRINSGILCGKVQPIPEAFCFRNRKREKTQLGLALRAHK